MRTENGGTSSHEEHDGPGRTALGSDELSPSRPAGAHSTADEGERARSSVMIVGPRLVQHALGALLGTRPDAQLLGSVELAQALVVARKSAPAVVVVEVPPRGSAHLRMLRGLRRLQPPTAVVLVADYCSREQVTLALDAGAHACISTEDGSDQLLKALDAVRNGERYISPIIARLVMNGSKSAALEPEMPPLEMLTNRERDVLPLIVQGKTERQIGKDLGLSPKTVHTHRTSIMRKLGVHNVIGLVRRAIQLGLANM